MNPLLELPVFSRIRRNHGLEHATIHLLSRSTPHRPLAGHSDMYGFWILGEVDTEELAETAQSALNRLRAGEHDLAVHPNCGTNFATYGIMAGTAAFLALAGAGSKTKDKLERLPLAATFATLALILAQPLAFRIQRNVTTSGDPRDLRITQVTRTMVAGRTAHRITTEG